MIDMQNIGKKIHYLSLLGCALGLSLSTVGHAQNFYKWVDTKGSTHYTATPPPKNAKKLGSVNTINDTPSGSSYIPNSSTQQATEQNNPQSEQNNSVAPQSNAPVTIEAPKDKISLPAKQADPTQGQPIAIGQGRAAT